MYFLNEFMEDGQLNIEKFQDFHSKQLRLLLSRLTDFTNLTYDEFRIIVDEMYTWEYISELVCTLDKRFEDFPSIFSSVNETIVEMYDSYLGEIDRALTQIDEDIGLFQLRAESNIVDKLDLIKEDLKKFGLYNKLKPKIEEINEKHKTEITSSFMSVETKRSSRLAKEIIVLIVEFALIVSFLVGLTYLGDPFLYEPPNILSFVSPQAYQGIALGFSALSVIGFIIFMSNKYKSLEFISSFFQISGIAFGVILLLVQFGFVQFGLWSAFYVFLFIAIFYTVFAQGVKQLTRWILIGTLIIEFILVTIYLIDFWSDSFQFMSDFWVSRFIVADIAILLAWIGSHSMEKTLKETPYILKLEQLEK